MTESEVIAAEAQLGDLPPLYRELLLSLPPSLDHAIWQPIMSPIGNVYLTASALMQANLALLTDGWLDGTEWEDLDLSDYLVVADDGCGNYYFCDPDDDTTPVQLLAHDPVGIEEAFDSMEDFIDEAKRFIKGGPPRSVAEQSDKESSPISLWSRISNWWRGE